MRTLIVHMGREILMNSLDIGSDARRPPVFICLIHEGNLAGSADRGTTLEWYSSSSKAPVNRIANRFINNCKVQNYERLYDESPWLAGTELFIENCFGFVPLPCNTIIGSFSAILRCLLACQWPTFTRQQERQDVCLLWNLECFKFAILIDVENDLCNW